MDTNTYHFFHFFFAFLFLFFFVILSSPLSFFTSLLFLASASSRTFSSPSHFTDLTLVLVLKLDGGLNHYPSPPCLRRHLSLSRARRRSNNKPNAVVLVVVSSGAKLMRQKKMVFVGVTAEKIGVQGE
ncbi:hypothetical protein HID58_086735 [Brassica napus]|uniref:Transmembrane protein n=2 Tax=Brassica TaxID=3705 RepID=A0ABQ7XRG1_BRANA|nr:hypothetical protein HID58_086735 [Brassica napus]